MTIKDEGRMLIRRHYDYLILPTADRYYAVARMADGDDGWEVEDRLFGTVAEAQDWIDYGGAEGWEEPWRYEELPIPVPPRLPVKPRLVSVWDARSHDN
jgi:hypothetical protein